MRQWVGNDGDMPPGPPVALWSLPAPAPAPVQAPGHAWALPDALIAQTAGEQPAPIAQEAAGAWFADPFAAWNYNTETMAGPPQWAAPANLAQVAEPGLSLGGYTGPTIDLGPVGEWATSAPTIAAPLVQWLTDTGNTLSGANVGGSTIAATLTDRAGVTTVAGTYTDTTSLLELFTPILAAVGANFLLPAFGAEAAAVAADASTIGTGFTLAEAAPVAFDAAAADAAIAADVAAWVTPTVESLMPTIIAPTVADAAIIGTGFTLAAPAPITWAPTVETIAADVAAWQAPAVLDLLPTIAAPVAEVATADAIVTRAPYVLPEPAPIAWAPPVESIAADVAAWQAPAVLDLLPTVAAPVAASQGAAGLASQVAGKVGTQAATIAAQKAAGAVLAGLGLGAAPTTGTTATNRPGSAPANPTTSAGGVMLLALLAFMVH